MKKAAILIDSSFGIKTNQYPDVYIVPMEITETTKEKTISYLDEVDIFNDELCDKIANGADIKTSQPIIGSVIQMLDKLSGEYERIYGLTIPSTISGTFGNWKMLEKDYPKLKVYDQTMVGRLSEWTIIDFTEVLKKDQLDDRFITTYLDRIRDKRAGVLIVPDVSQLKKGGRVSNFKSILIRLLNLKLIITLDKTGLMFKDKANKPDETVERAKKALEQCVSLSNSTIKRFTIFTNSKANKKFDIDQYLNILKDIYPRVNMEHAEMPAVITAHTGPNYFVFGVDLE